MSQTIRKLLDGITVKAPKRSILYVRVKAENKEFLEYMAKENGASLTLIIDAILDKYRKAK